MVKLNPKDNAAHLFCLFIAEEMRMHTVSLGEAKEIARALVAHQNLIDNEEHMLRLVMELSKDYPALKRFEKKIATYVDQKSRSESEKKVTEFVSAIMDTDQNLAMQILDDAISSGNSLDMLVAKYPKFSEFLNQTK